MNTWLTLVWLWSGQDAPESEERTFTVTATAGQEHVLASDRILVRGNVVLPTQVYRSLVQLPDRWPPTEQALDRAARGLHHFLIDAGYLLARVQAKAEGEQVVFYVDEGRLERLTFPGKIGLGALRLQLELDLPGSVFNKPSLDEQLTRFAKDYQLRVREYRLVPSQIGTKSGVQLSSMMELRGVPVLPEQGLFELQIFTDEPELPPGLHLELDGRPADGLRSRLKYRFESLIFDDDRLEPSVEIGVRVQDFLGAPKTRRKLSRLAVGLIAYSPRISNVPVRVLLWPEVRWHSRQRLDLEVLTYDFLFVDPRLLLMVVVSDRLELYVGGGVEYQRLLTLERVGAAPLVEPFAAMQPFLFLKGDFRLGGEITRLDQQHVFELELRQVLALHGDWRSQARASWNKTIPLGFDEVRLGLSGMAVFGRVAFTDEDRVGDALRGGLFGEEIYCDGVATAALEFRWSLFRELYKVGVFHDGAVCHSGLDDRWRVANAFGVSFHALLLNTFRLSISVAQGFASGGRSDQGLSVALSQVF
ncbi:MAG: hypothetical protein IPG45_32130 [Deltaproteobacteria bacterium]|nr:hypothetical protein [Deltaproteobacteria bacterium]